MAGRGVVFALAGFALLLAAVAVSSIWSGATQLAGDDDHRDVARVARRFVEAFGAFETTSPDGYRDRLIGLAADPLRGELAGAIVDPAAIAERRSIRTDIDHVSVTAVADGKARVSVAARQERRWIDPRSGAPMSETVTQRLALTLVYEDERWLVNQVQLLADAPASN